MNSSSLKLAVAIRHLTRIIEEKMEIIDCLIDKDLLQLIEGLHMILVTSYHKLQDLIEDAFRCFVILSHSQLSRDSSFASYYKSLSHPLLSFSSDLGIQL